MFNQLRAIQPPVAEQVIQTEGRALDEAIARLEIEAATQPSRRARRPPPAPRRPNPSGSPKTNRARPAAGTAAARRAAAAPPETSSGTRRIVGIVAVLVVLVGAVALAALHFRERPEDLAKLKPEDARRPSIEQGQIRRRAPAATIRATAAGRPCPSRKRRNWSSRRRKHPDKVEHAYNGTVVWRLENVGGGEGEPLKSAIRGDIDFPDAKTKATL